MKIWKKNLFSDLDKAEKILLISEILCEFDNKGVEMTPEQKKLFMLLGDSLPDMKNLFQEYNPEIPWLTREYIKEKYNLSDEEVEKYISEGKEDMDPDEPEGEE